MSLVNKNNNNTTSKFQHNFFPTQPNTMAQVTDQVLLTFDDFKLGKADAGFLKLQLVDGHIDLVKKGKTDPKPTWEELVEAECEKGEPAWILYHFSYQTKEAGKRSKLMLVQWIPDDSGVSKKMQYAMWSNNLKQSLNGVACVIRATGEADLDYQEVLERASKFERDELAA